MYIYSCHERKQLHQRVCVKGFVPTKVCKKSPASTHRIAWTEQWDTPGHHQSTTHQRRTTFTHMFLVCQHHGTMKGRRPHQPAWHSDITDLVSPHRLQATPGVYTRKFHMKPRKRTFHRRLAKPPETQSNIRTKLRGAAQMEHCDIKPRGHHKGPCSPARLHACPFSSAME